ncbi:MAG: FG-GAP repeat domain-containing protein [Armatimonadota bacterium]
MRLVIAIMSLLALAQLAGAQETKPIPEPVVPVYTKLKDLHLKTPLVSAGKPVITIVAPAPYQAEGKAIQAAIQKLTDAVVPIIEEAHLPLTGNLICLGNRSTNRTISGLYDRGYTFLDLKYPGPGGYVVRSLHNPFGDGRNVLFVGGSDAAGVKTATEAFAAAVGRGLRAAPGELSLGYLCNIKLSPAYTVPSDLKQVEIWEASRMYGSSGYFGWNMVSKNMALYYMTGDEKYLKEFLRLGFPDKAAIKEIEDYDGERIENKNDPLAGPYHYSAHMMIEMWDLIEESPSFTDEQRLKITNALARQLPHRVVEGVYNATTPRQHVGDRHGDWSAFSLYALGRYFNKDYPSAVWQHCLDASDRYFDTLKRTYWMAGNNDHLFWFTSYYDPMLNYLLFSGRRDADMLANLRRGLESQEILSTGLDTDWGTNASSLSMLGKAAHILGDGRWLWYRERTNLNLECFRLGQSFWADGALPVKQPTDLAGKWLIHWMPEGMWKARNTGLPQNQSFRWGSYRSEIGPGGDYILLDGYNGAGRNPYHTFDILELRLGGATLLKGYHNQVLSSADGMVEPEVAMDGALLHQDVVGQTAAAVAEVPKLPFATWRRSLAQRVGRYAVIADDLTFRTNSDNIKLETSWEMPGATWLPALQAMRTRAYTSNATPPGWLSFRAIEQSNTCGPGTAADLLSRLGSLDMLLLKAPGPGAWVEMPFEIKQPLTGEVFADLLNYEDRGIVRLSLDGQPVGEEIDHYSPSVATQRVSLGKHDLTAGTHRLRLEIVGKRAAAKRCYAGLLGVRIQPEGTASAVPQVVYELRSSEPLDVTPGAVTNMVWRGSATNGQRRTFFHLLGQNAAASDDALACLRLADNAAALAVPEAGIACSGQYGGLQGDLVILTEKSLYGHNLKQAGLTGGAGILPVNLLSSDQPIDVDWDFQSGTLVILNPQPTAVTVALQSSAISLNGKAITAKTANGLCTLNLAAGRQQITGATPSTAALKPLTAALSAEVQQARAARQTQLAASAGKPTVSATEMKAIGKASLGGSPVATAIIPSPDGDRLCLATGKTAVIFDAAGKELRRLTTEGDIRVLRWWAAPKLLLVGCADEKVIAFDEAGQKQWEFTSVMDKAVYEAGKQYWFKSAYPGIYGLYSGAFDGGKNRAFVGSACTLEILDEQGQLVKRLPVFWGPGRQFLMVDAEDGTKNLLVGRWHNDGVAFAKVNSGKMADIGHGYDGVPAGHTFVGGWDCMNRYDNFLTDLEGDGQREVVSAINGTWNRVTVYSETGQPLHNAQFGPGLSEARANLRMMDVGDLNGDGKQEIIVGLAGGLLDVLDARCQKLWAKQLPSPPTVVRLLKAATGNWLCVGCEDGTVLAVDAKGQITRSGKAGGKPQDLQVLQTPQGETAVMTTDKGEITLFGR